MQDFSSSALIFIRVETRAGPYFDFRHGFHLCSPGLYPLKAFIRHELIVGWVAVCFGKKYQAQRIENRQCWCAFADDSREHCLRRGSLPIGEDIALEEVDMPSLKAPLAFVSLMLLTSSLFGCMPKSFSGLSTSEKAHAEQKLSSGTNAAESDKDAQVDEYSTTAIEPTAIAGAHLIDPKKLKIQRTSASADIRTDPAAVISMPSSQPKEADIELYTYDSVGKNFEISNDIMILNLKKVASTRAAPDGSFAIQASVTDAEWLFVKIADGDGASLKVSPKEPKNSIVWIDSDGNRPRVMDQASAYTLRGMISPTASLLEAIDRLKTTKACVDCDLNGADLRGQNWNAYNFMGAKLMGAKFNNSSITNSDLRNTDLRAVDFAVCYLALSDFTGAITTGANFQGADTQNATGLIISP